MNIVLQLILIFVVAYFADLLAISTWEEYKRRQQQQSIANLFSHLQDALDVVAEKEDDDNES